MKILKIIFLFFIILTLSFLFALIDFSFLFLNFPDVSRDFTDLVRQRGIEIINSSPLNIEGNGIYLSLEEEKVVLETNIERNKYGLVPLKIDTKLNLSALNKNKDMCQNQYFDHISLDNEGPSDLVKKVGYEFVVVAENLAMGSFLNEKDLVNSWMNSKGHRENILSEDYVEIGVSVLRCNYEGRNVWLATQHFGVPVSICPEVDNSLKLKIDLNQKILNDLYLKIEELKSEFSLFKVRRGSDYLEKYKLYSGFITEYNILVGETEILIDEYNNQIILFNSCADSFK